MSSAGFLWISDDWSNASAATASVIGIVSNGSELLVLVPRVAVSALFTQSFSCSCHVSLSQHCLLRASLETVLLRAFVAMLQKRTIHCDLTRNSRSTANAEAAKVPRVLSTLAVHTWDCMHMTGFAAGEGRGHITISENYFKFEVLPPRPEPKAPPAPAPAPAPKYEDYATQDLFVPEDALETIPMKDEVAADALVLRQRQVAQARETLNKQC